MPYSDPVKAKERYRAYYLANCDRIKAQTKAYIAAHPEENRARRRVYQKKRTATDTVFAEKRRALKREWYTKNKARVFKWQSLYRKNRSVADPIFAKERKLRSMLNALIKQCVKSSSDRFVDLIGCSRVQFRQHIESLWRSGMCWENHGTLGWHIDHIMTCSKFDLSSEDEVKKCFHYKNLQPLWAYENLKKGAS